MLFYFCLFSLRISDFLYSRRAFEPGVLLIRHIHYSSIDPAVSFGAVLSVHLINSIMKLSAEVSTYI